MSARSLLTLGSTAVLALGFSFASTTGAQAASMSAVDIMNSYNLVVFGDLDSKSEVEGKTFVQGDVTGGNTSQYNIHDVQQNALPALTVGGGIKSGVTVDGRGLVVGGDIAAPVQVNENGSVGNPDVVVGGNVKSTISGQFNGNGGSMYVKGSVQSGATATANGGNLYVTGPVSGTASANGSGTTHLNSPEPASHVPDIATQATQMKQTLTGYSQYLNSLQAGSTVSVVSGTAEFNAVAGANGVAVFDVSDASVLSAGQFSFNAGSDVTSIIINVSVSGLIDIATNFIGDAASLASKIIWNFTDATGVTTERDFDGNILALLANFTNNQDIEGSVFAQSVTQNGEIHYAGQVPGVLQTPVPASLPLFAAALAGLVGWRQFRRRQEQGQLAA